jgi:hypothetical protein
MRLMPQLTRRAALRLGAGALAGAAGMWASSTLLDPAEAVTFVPAVRAGGGHRFTDPADRFFPARQSGSAGVRCDRCRRAIPTGIGEHPVRTPG